MRVYLKCLIYLIILSIIFGCSSHIRISKINEEPRKYQDKKVTIKGVVVNTFAIFGSSMYQVDDGTGVIWVSTQKKIPFSGKKVVVTGIVQSAFVLNDKAFGTVIFEK